MTREEAIANLNMISVAFVEPVTKEQRKLIDDTFEMAIKALEQEPYKVSEYDKDHIWYKGWQYISLHRFLEVKAVTQQEPKTGHWIDIMVGDMPAQACDRCNTFYPLAYTGGGHKYCPNCGCRMVEPQERSGKE